MLHLIDDLYTAHSNSAQSDQRIMDMLHYIEQLLDGKQLNDDHVAKLQQIGLKAFNR